MTDEQKRSFILQAWYDQNWPYWWQHDPNIMSRFMEEAMHLRRISGELLDVVYTTKRAELAKLRRYAKYGRTDVDAGVAP